MQVQEYKISLLGEKQIGKTRFVKKLYGNYTEEAIYKPTIGVEVTPIDINGNEGKIRVSIWDNSGDERYRGLKEQYHINSTLVIILKSNNENYKQYESEVPQNTPVIYLNANENKSVEEYKTIIYNALINN